MDDLERYGPVRAASMAAERRAGVRARALRRLPLVAALPAVAVPAGWLAQEWARARGLHFGRWLAIGMALSAVPLLVAICEEAAGIEFRELSRRWDELAGWQRGIVGTLVAVAALGTFGAIAFAIAVSHAG